MIQSIFANLALFQALVIGIKSVSLCRTQSLLVFELEHRNMFPYYVSHSRRIIPNTGYHFRDRLYLFHVSCYF